MFDKLEHIVRRMAEINALLSDPVVLADQRRSRDLGRELHTLEPIVRALERYRAVEKNLQGSKELLEAGGDPEMKALAQEEYDASRAALESLGGELKHLLVPKDPNDDKNFIMEIRAGTGGDEAALFAADLHRMYTRFAERKGWKVELMDWSETG
ncbi:MAG: PCRF domain-containing protein, partial [Bacteroidota bacterium]